MSLNEKIISDMTAAMKAKDAERLSTLRMVKSNLMNRKIEKGGELTDEEVTKALQTLVKQRKDSFEQYTNAGRAELAEKEASEIKVIEEYLPKAASNEEIEQAVTEAITRNRRDFDQRNGLGNESRPRQTRRQKRRRQNRQRNRQSQTF